MLVNVLSFIGMVLLQILSHLVSIIFTIIILVCTYLVIDALLVNHKAWKQAKTS